MSDFKLSVITVCFNEINSIETTLRSVVNQAWFDNIEYIVIDGGSTDGTVDVIKRFQSKIDVFVCEPDNGIYDAMNKGVRLASGEWIQFMNAGDVYSNSRVVANVLGDKHHNADIIYGWSNRVTALGNIYPCRPSSVEKLRAGATFRHGASFIRSRVHKVNEYKVDRKDLGFALDYKFFFDAFNEGFIFECVNEFVIDYLEDGVSANKYKSVQFNSRITDESTNVLVKNFKLLKKYLKLSIRDSYIIRPIKLFKYFFVNWFVCRVVSVIPFWWVRSFFYRLIGVRIGGGTTVNQGFQFFSPERLTIEDHSHINRNCFIDARGYCFIGKAVSISHEVMILTGTHDINSASFSEIHRPVYIGDNVWVGARAVILPGVSVGEGAVIAAGAVVLKDVEPYEVVGGIPAKHISNRSKGLEYVCSWGIPFV